MFMPHSAACLEADTHQMAFSGQRPQLLPSVAYAPSGIPVGEIQPHRAISAPRNDKGLAFTDGHHPQTHNYRPACGRTGLETPRRPSMVVQKIYRVTVGLASDLADLGYSGRQ